MPKKYGEHMKLSEFRDELPEKAVMRVQGVILLYCLLKLMMYALVGYIEARYYVEPMKQAIRNVRSFPVRRNVRAEAAICITAITVLFVRHRHGNI